MFQLVFTEYYLREISRVFSDYYGRQLFVGGPPLYDNLITSDRASPFPKQLFVYVIHAILLFVVVMCLRMTGGTCRNGRL